MFNLPAPRHFAIAAALLLLVPASGSAQRLAPEFARMAEPWSNEQAPKTVAVFGHPDDYRWEGALVGAIGGGLFGAVVVAEWCRYDHEDSVPECALRGLLALVVGGVVGGGVGGLVGGLFPKEKPAP